MGRPRKNAVADMNKENDQVVSPEDVIQETQSENEPLELVTEDVPAKKKTRGRTKKADKETLKEEEKKTIKKDLKAYVTVQYSGKTYTQDDLIKIAKDIWKYDYKRKIKELETVQFYVKTEENTVYYVMNNEVEGSFTI